MICVSMDHSFKPNIGYFLSVTPNPLQLRLCIKKTFADIVIMAFPRKGKRSFRTPRGIKHMWGLAGTHGQLPYHKLCVHVFCTHVYVEQVHSQEPPVLVSPTRGKMEGASALWRDLSHVGSDGYPCVHPVKPCYYIKKSWWRSIYIYMVPTLS